MKEADTAYKILKSRITHRTIHKMHGEISIVFNSALIAFEIQTLGTLSSKMWNVTRELERQISGQLNYTINMAALLHYINHKTHNGLRIHYLPTYIHVSRHDCKPVFQDKWAITWCIMRMQFTPINLLLARTLARDEWTTVHLTSASGKPYCQ